MNESRLAELRRAKGWTRERLAGESGIAVRTIQRLESGKDARLDTISRISKALDMAVGELFIRAATGRFDVAVEGLEQRVTEEQERRYSIAQGIILVCRALGLLVTFGTVILVIVGPFGWFTWLVIPAYWAGGWLLLETIYRLAIDPRLDEKYPLTKANRGLLG